MVFDCTCAALDVRKGSVLVESEPHPHDLNCVAICPVEPTQKMLSRPSRGAGSSAGSSANAEPALKVAVGANDGAINLFNWNEFGNIVDRCVAYFHFTNTVLLYTCTIQYITVFDSLDCS